MKKLIIILSIIILPMLIFWGLEKMDKNSETAEAQIPNKPTVLKFYSEMCLDCKLLTDEIGKIQPKYKEQVVIQHINIHSDNKKLMKKYAVEVVPTCIFMDKNGTVKLKKEGFIAKNLFEKYLDDIING